MRRLSIAILSAAVLLLPAAAATAQPNRAPAPAQRDWTANVVATPEGGFRMGNPDARVKVVEFLSLTCGHCAEFARNGVPNLVRNHVRSGRVSLEYRNFVLNPIDATASVLARCAGAAHFFPMVEQLYASQEQWVGRISGFLERERDQINALPMTQRLTRVAEQGGLTAIAAQHNVPAARARQCLADEAGLNQLAEMYQAAAALGVEGTPTFLINGTRVPANDWPSIERLIRQAGG
jgi:protein-disulfide isomerase